VVEKDELAGIFVGDNEADSLEFRAIAEFDLGDPAAASVLADFGGATLITKVTFTRGTVPDIRVVALDTDENGDIETGSESAAANDFQAAGTKVTVLSGLQEGDEIRIDVTEYVRADLGKGWSSFRFEGVGIDPPTTPGADQIRIGGPAGDGLGLETATRLVLTPKGDFDASGSVSLADFHTFRSMLGEGAAWDQGDLDGNGYFDAADFLAFRDRFGPAESDSADYNNDQRSDLLDYALQILDSADISGKLPVLTVVESGGKHYLQTSFRRFTGGSGDPAEGYHAGGVTLKVARSETLQPGSWASGSALLQEAGVPVDNLDGTETVTVRTLTALEDTADGRAFLRLAVESP